MHTGTLRKMALALTFWLALHMSSIKAQILLGPYSNSTASFEVNANGLLMDTGSGGTLSLSGAGTRMFWYPGKAAFRAGSVNGTQWDDTTANPNIGQYSVAMGLNTSASGYASVALGTGQAAGLGSVALGGSASGPGSVALGGTASGNYSVAMGSGQAVGNYSTVMGYSCSAYGYCSVAMGNRSSAIGMGSFTNGLGSSASGYYSVAFGESSASGNYSMAFEESSASGRNSTAMGSGTANGDYSTSSGYYTQATSFADFVIGAYNVGSAEDGSQSSSTSWKNTPNHADPLFEIGNGTSPTFGEINPSDAFVVYKDGNVTAQGVITAAAGGDIPMYGE